MTLEPTEVRRGPNIVSASACPGLSPAFRSGRELGQLAGGVNLSIPPNLFVHLLTNRPVLS
jgi:hypothetical protein